MVDQKAWSNWYIAVVSPSCSCTLFLPSILSFCYLPRSTCVAITPTNALPIPRRSLATCVPLASPRPLPRHRL